MTLSSVCPWKQADKHSNGTGKLAFNNLFGIVAHWQKGNQSVRKSELPSFLQTHFAQQALLNCWPRSCIRDQYKLSRVKKGMYTHFPLSNVYIPFCSSTACTLLPLCFHCDVQTSYLFSFTKKMLKTKRKLCISSCKNTHQQKSPIQRREATFIRSPGKCLKGKPHNPLKPKH